MAKVSHYVERLGVRVEGFATKREALAAWFAKRDEWCERAARGSWVFAWHGHTLIVAPTVHGWEYTIARPGGAGVVRAACFYGAPNQVAAIGEALGALAQTLWDDSIPDDGAFFDSLTSAARLHASEAARQRADFVHVAAHWRAHRLEVA